MLQSHRRRRYCRHEWKLVDILCSYDEDTGFCMLHGYSICKKCGRCNIINRIELGSSSYIE